MAAYLLIKTRITDATQYQKYVEAARALGGPDGEGAARRPGEREPVTHWRFA